MGIKRGTLIKRTSGGKIATTCPGGPCGPYASSYRLTMTQTVGYGGGTPFVFPYDEPLLLDTNTCTWASVAGDIRLSLVGGSWVLEVDDYYIFVTGTSTKPGPSPIGSYPDINLTDGIPDGFTSDYTEIEVS